MLCCVFTAFEVKLYYHGIYDLSTVPNGNNTRAILFSGSFSKYLILNETIKRVDSECDRDPFFFKTRFLPGVKVASR